MIDYVCCTLYNVLCIYNVWMYLCMMYEQEVTSYELQVTSFKSRSKFESRSFLIYNLKI